MRTASTPSVGMKDSFETGLRMERYTLARSVATILGAVLIAIGILGFVSPGLLGTHLSVTHNLVHLVSGAASLYFGLFGTASGASLFCMTFGVVYGLLAVAGFAFGGAEQHTIEGITHGIDTRLIQLIPGKLELAMPDHLVHAAVALLYFAAGVIGAPPAMTRRSGDRRMTTTTRMPPPPPL
jgi:hypothetical protein